MALSHLKIAVVGGSLAGLMQGVALKRAGHDVTIFEQHLSSDRQGQAAGIVVMQYGQAFMNAYDLLKDQPFAVNCKGVQVLDRKLNVVQARSSPLKMTSWNILYHRLRANFDGLPSAYCPSPPKDSLQDGYAAYKQGMRVKNVRSDEGIIYLDIETVGVPGSVAETFQADIVIAADGSASTLRTVVEPSVERRYAGYVAWRGTVLEEDISQETRDVFKLTTTLCTTKSGYIALYTIPGENGNLEPGKRLLNYVWYQNMPDTSDTYIQSMTDVDGHRHRHTLPIGKMQSEVWDRQREWARRNLSPPFAELIDKTTQPFISSISDVAISRASFFNGKLLFVGDALTLFRPHVACSTNQAALDAILLEKFVKGEISLEQWERRVMAYANLTRLRSITWGTWYQSGFPSFIISKVHLWMATQAAAFQAYWYKDQTD